jgi:two-component system, LytTR family, sensor kinase
MTIRDKSLVTESLTTTAVSSHSTDWFAPKTGDSAAKGASEAMKAEGRVRKSRFGESERKQPFFMHPAIFVGASVLLGLSFALQEWTHSRLWSYHIGILQVLEAWGVQYFIWGVICWLLWWQFGPAIQSARGAAILTRLLPLSIVISVLEEMIWVLLFPKFPVSRIPMTYWQRFAFELNGEFVDNLVIFWCAFGLFRGVGYYQKYLEKEDVAKQLEAQLASAQLSALRIQLNPHFLFNTMNNISGMMRSDIDAADMMLEQLSSLLRITLLRGNSQLIPLRDEVDFIEIYLALQERRYGDRVRQIVSIDPELHDALVPVMILQPIVENAYVHGLSKLDKGGCLSIAARRVGVNVCLTVQNNGIGLLNYPPKASEGHGVGLANIRSRLELHYANHHRFAIREIERTQVEIAITFPLTLSQDQTELITRFGA